MVRYTVMINGEKKGYLFVAERSVRIERDARDSLRHKFAGAVVELTESHDMYYAFMPTSVGE